MNFRDVCLAVQEIYRDAEWARFGKFPVSVEDFLAPAVARFNRPGRGAGFDVTIHEKKWNHKDLYGLLLRYKDSAEIVVAADMRYCWRRFVVCKELAHLILDTPKSQSYTVDPVALVQSLISNIGDLGTDNAIASEHLATLAAHEMIVPWCMREQIYEMEKAGCPHLEIATHCFAPELAITLMLSDRYREQSAQNNRI